MFAFRALFVLFIIWASAATIANAPAQAAHAGHSQHSIFLLALTEIVGSLLFLLDRTQLVGLLALLLVFTIAAVETTLLGDAPVRFLYFAANAVFIYAIDKIIKMEATAEVH